MSLQDDMNNINDYLGFGKGNIGLAYFEGLRAKPFFRDYSATTLYRAYIMEYLILLWDNTYYLLINSDAKRPKLHGITNNLLGSKFIKSVGYRRLVELQDFLENNYFSKYSLDRYLTQAWTNYLFNKQINYRYIPLNRIYSKKVKKQYLELSQGLADETIQQDNLSLTDDPVTLALLNYYYYLDRNNYNSLIENFEATLINNFSLDITEKYYTVKHSGIAAVILYFIFSVGISYEPYTFSYGDNLLLSQDTKIFSNDNLQQKANDYLVGSSCDSTLNITLALSRVGTFKEILHVICNKQLGCEPITKDELNIFKTLGYRIDEINNLRVDSIYHGKNAKCNKQRTDII